MSFTSDLQKFVKKCDDNENRVVRKVALDIGTAVTMRTPVGDADYWKNPAPAGYTGGHARANWQLTEGTLQPQEHAVIDKTGKASLSRISAALPKQAAGKVLFISNSVPYIIPLEDGTGSPRQCPPGGMVAVTMTEVNNFVRDAIKELP